MALLRRLPRSLLLSALALVSCTSAGSGADAADSDLTASDAVPLTLVFVHGVNGDDGSRRAAGDSLKSLDEYVREQVAARADGARVALRTFRVNVYTDASGALRQPSIDSASDGTGQATAMAWRTATVAKIREQLLPTDRNIVLVGHSTGARVSMEIAANVDGVGAELQDRIVGVVTINGMIDALDKREYNAAGPLSFHTLCRHSQETGWCDYAAFVSGLDAANWTATHKHALGLVSYGDCPRSIWAGWSDKSLPAAAQSAPLVPGLGLVPGPGQTFVPSHGDYYGEYCHSDITNADSPRHEGARRSVGDRILTWLFDRAPRVVNADETSGWTIAPIGGDAVSSERRTTGACSPGRKSGGSDVVGVCRHPGAFDGDDHPVGKEEIATFDDERCAASIRWDHGHAEARGALLYAKAYSVPEGGGLVSTLR